MNLDQTDGTCQPSSIITHFVDGFVIEESDKPFVKPSAVKYSSGTNDVSTENIRQLSKKFPYPSKTSTVNQVSYKHQNDTSNSKVSRISRQFYVKRTEMAVFDSTNIEDSDSRRHTENFLQHSISNESIHTDQLDTAWLTSNPYTWSSHQVAYFICMIDGCERYGQLFLNEQVDGEALLLLREEHLLSVLNLKLGPALKILAKVKKLRTEWTNKKLPNMQYD